MIRSLKRYLQTEMWPRRAHLLFAIAPWLALAIALGVSHLLVRQTSCLNGHAFLGAVLTYSSIAFGFCVTAITMCLALNDKAFVEEMMRTKAKGRHHSTYSDLIFEFTWTAFCHILLVACCVVGLFSFNAQDPLFHPHALWFQTGASGFIVGLFAYCIFQFLTTILTLSSVGAVYVHVTMRSVRSREREEALKASLAADQDIKDIKESQPGQEH